ncbi:hypothetical protein [Sphingobacterium thalpophilum]|uniref:Uncharacterized protein n=1 Tax=Sphingobacterium thalpophilum TaxID=259 RepID=A0A4U9VVD7_9SPHI|nr:hypothetical protein [Sphingobacterium thalpophilum]VTR51510.1 Uncharacterised protein [Sphingobacterium thalpophilum]
MSENYREYLVKTVFELDKFLDELDLNITNLAMNGEFSEANDLFDEGDTLSLSIADFEDANDMNVRKLINVFHFLTDIKKSLKNVNAISDEEIDNYDDLPF